MTPKRTLFALTMAAAMLPAAAFAEMAATTATDLNMRAGPGPNYEILTTMPANAQVGLGGCIEGGSWCQVNYGGQTGWASSNYLRADVGGQMVVVEERRADIPVVSFVGDVVGGAVAGALGVAGAAVNAALTPPRTVVDYVTTNRYDPVYLDGEVVVGAEVPETLELRTIPDYEYRYAYVNGQPVLIEPGTRRIVYVHR
jgi:uncharacterized protein YraI